MAFERKITRFEIWGIFCSAGFTNEIELKNIILLIHLKNIIMLRFSIFFDS